MADIDMSVVLWGAPGSGKSTYLAALSRAAAAANWTLTPRGPDATAALTQMKDRFLGRRNFPDATPLKVRSYAFVLWGELGISSVTPILSRTKRARVRINLSIVDPAGQLYESDRFGQFLEDELAELADSLASAQGIIFFFDPTGESEDGAAFRHFHAMATHLMSENMERSGREHYGRRLPHRLAVCVSKFDHPDVFSVAEAAGYSDAKGGGLPVVPEGRAEEFFNLMCGRDWRHGAREESSIDMGLRGEIQNCFDRDNVRYFATSSIGFHLGPSGEFSREDFVNIKGSGISREVRGSINPINVLEPLIWLGAQEVRAAASASYS